MASEIRTTDAERAAASNPQTIDQLGFVKRRPKGGLNLWNPKAVRGGWAKQCRAGRQLAEQATAYIQATGDAALLPGVARTIAERGSWGGVEVGFFAGLSDSLAQAAI